MSMQSQGSEEAEAECSDGRKRGQPHQDRLGRLVQRKSGVLLLEEKKRKLSR